MFLTTRLAIAAIAGIVVAPLLPGTALVALLAVDGALVVAVAVDVARAPSSVALAREIPEVVTIGERAPVVLRLRNPLARPLDVAVHDAVVPSLRREPRRHRARIAPRSAVTLEAWITPARRGVFAFGPVTVRAAGPLGLAGRQRRSSLPGRLKVYPALPGRTQVELRVEHARLLQSGERSSAVRGGGTEFDSLREYHRDDEFRRINWRATARAAKPVSNVYREERNQQVLVLLDASRMMAPNVAGVSRFEHAIDGAMTVASLAARIGDQVGMLCFGAGVRAAVGPKSSRAQPARILEALFALEPSLDAPDYRGAFASLLARHRRRALLVLLTELADESAMEPLFEALPALLARHLVIVGSVRDPEIEAMAALWPASSEEAYAKAAAAGALSARDRAAARLRGMGVRVADRPPGELAGSLADAYLRIKAYGRL